MTLTSAQRRLLPPLLLILLALLPVWPAVVLGHAIGPVDHIRAMVDPSASKPETPWNVLQADSLLQFRVWRGLVFEGWAQGRIPTWNAYSLLGTPLLGNSQSGALYPFHILMGVARVPLDRAIGLLAWFHLALAGIGTSRLCRALGTDRASAFFGASGFMLSAFLLVWTPLASVPSTVAWIPWLLFWVQRRRFGWLAACAGMMLLAGHLQFAVYGLIGAGVYALLARAWTMLPALGLGLALAAAQLMPVMAFSQFSHRRAAPSEEGYAAYAKSAIQPWQLGVLAAPGAYGLPQEPAPVEGLPAGGYWPSVVKIGDNFAEGAISLSPAAFVLLGLVRWRDRRVWAIAAVAIVGLLLALPTALPRLLYSTLPGWSATGSPGRAAVLFVLAGCVLGALGLTRLLSTEKAARFAPALFGTALLGALLAFAAPRLAPDDALGLGPERLGEWQSHFMWTGMVGAVGSAALLFGLASSRFRLVTALLPVLFALTYAPGLIPSGEFPALPTAPPGARVAVVEDRWSFFSTPKAILPPNLLAAARIVDTGGYDSLIHRDTKAMLDAANGGDSAPPENGNMMLIKSTATDERLRDLGVSEVWSRDAANGGIARRKLARGAGEEFAWVSRVELNRSAMDRPDVRFTPDGFSVTRLAVGGAPGNEMEIKERNLPGWTASAGTIRPGPWLTLDLPPRAERVELRYDPPGLRTGLLVSLAAFLALIAVFYVESRRDRGKAEEAFV